MKLTQMMITLAFALTSIGCGSCNEEPPGVCAEVNGSACTCASGRTGVYDCSADCVCGSSSSNIGIEPDLGHTPDVGGRDMAIEDLSDEDMSADAGPDVPADRVAIAAGTFAMGCEQDTACDPDETPVHDVMLSAFSIDRTEVSRASFQLCIDDGDCTTPAMGFELDGGKADLPVTAVTFAQAVAYCTWAGGRLPTEAEWERACTGGDARTFPWGDEDATCDLANTAGCAPGGANGEMIVDSLEAGATPEGALHMAGNVWEWTADWYDELAYAAHSPTDPTGPATGMSRVYRGGSSGNDPSLARCRNRASTYNPAVGGSGLGFRCAYD